MNLSLIRLRYLLPAAAAWTAAALHAATYHVAPTGHDAAAGTATAPFQTIQRGVDAASAGDTVLVAPGTYATGVQTTTPASGTSRVTITKPITVRSQSGAAQTIIQGQPHSSNVRFGVDAVRCVYMSAGVLDGFTLKDGYANANAPGTTMTDPFKNGGGVYAPEGNRTPQVNNCIITQCGAYRGGGAHWATLNNCTVVNNYINTTSGAGVYSCHVFNSIVFFNGASNEKNYSAASNSDDQSLFISSCTSPAPSVNFYGTARDGGNNLTTAPLFAAGTLTLADASPCINAGNNAYASGALDAAGAPRIQGGIVDIGAYERGKLYNQLTVVNGSGSGTYSNGASIAISANPSDAWTIFAGWVGDTAAVANTTVTNTTVSMPASDITVTATYHSPSFADYLGETLGIPQPVTAGNLSHPHVNPAVPEVMLGDIGDNQTAFFATVYTNAGTLLFPWRVSSEANYDELRLIVDGVVTQAISGLFSGTVTQSVTGAGAHTVRWEYRKDGSSDDWDDAGWIGAVTWIPEPLAAELGVSGRPVAFPDGHPGRPLPFPYGFEACFLDTAAPGGAVGGVAVKLGGLNPSGVPYFADNTTNSVAISLYGAGQFTFAWAASNQPSDTVICFIDGVEAARLSGKATGWVPFATNLTDTGEHVVRWAYTKGPAGFGEVDAVWIDNVTWTHTTATLTVIDGSGSGTYPIGAPVTLTASAAPAGQMFAQWSGDTESLANPLSPATTLVMPAANITVRALFKAQTWDLTIINGRDAGAWPTPAYAQATGEPEDLYPAGALVRVVADPAPLWQTFDRWTASPVVVFSNDAADVSMFVMPAGPVTVTATYRAMTEAEKLGDALTIRGQRIDITDFSPSGVVAVATDGGGIRYDDPVVQMGGPDVGAGQNVYLTTTNFTGNGYLCMWWHGDTEDDVDGLQLEVNGVPYPIGVFSDKDTNTADRIRVWWGGHLPLMNVTNITWRYTCDDSYYVHQNVVLLDRVIWIPVAMVEALGAGACVPNINQEYDPLFRGLGHDAGDYDFEGEDGGVTWVDDAPGGGGAIRLGRFGYVTNNLCAQVAITNFGTGRFTWEWTANSERAHDRLGLAIDGTFTNWISGKLNGLWYSSLFTVTSDRFDGDETRNIFNFRYQKDADVSVFDDCAWLRNVRWHPSHKLTVNSGTVISGATTEPGYFLEGAAVTVAADTPEPGYYFERWTGTNVLAALGAAVVNATATFAMPPRSLELTATYTTNEPAVAHTTLTVINGSGSGAYPVGQSVAITADEPTLWHVFLGWSGATNALANPMAPATTALIGTNTLVVTANYAAVPVDVLLQSVLGLPAPVSFGNLTAANIGSDSATLGPVNDSATAFFEAVYTNAGTVIFPWAVDSEEDYDFFIFTVDGADMLKVSGAQSGVLTNFVAGDGPHTLKWAYVKDVSYPAGADCAVIGPVTWIPDALAVELGTPGKTLYAPGGFGAVLLDTAPPAGAVSNLAVRLGGGGTLGHTASVTLGTVYSGSGKLAFHWRVSSEKGYDFLTMMVDGIQVARISGAKDGWIGFETNLLTVANHDVRWIYSKDGSGSVGDDCGWIDSVSWTQFSYALTVQNGTIQPGGATSGTFAVADTLTVVANPAPAGMEFDAWDGDTDVLANLYAATTTLTMPATHCLIRAIYKPLSLAVTLINGRDAGAWTNAFNEGAGDPKGAYPAGTLVRIIADPAPLWQTFAGWDSTNGAVFVDASNAITMFTMPNHSVTVEATYRNQTDNEKLASALTIAGQPLNVTAFSPNGIVASATGGVRYSDPVVRLGGSSVGPSQSVGLTVTNFTGDGVLLYWWKASAESRYDGLQLRVNGTPQGAIHSGKDTQWHLSTNWVTAAASIEFRFVRDSSYFVRDNTILVDRVTWIPRDMLEALGGIAYIPNINRENNGFSGEDGGVTWVFDAPPTNGGAAAVSAVQMGNFGYVNNSQHAQLSVNRTGTGIMLWDWATLSEADYDLLSFHRDGETNRWISGKEQAWETTGYAVTNILDPSWTREMNLSERHTFVYLYRKDADTSVFKDCAWLRNATWTPTVALILGYATPVSFLIPGAFTDPALPYDLLKAVTDEAANGYFPQGTIAQVKAAAASGGQAFAYWSGGPNIDAVLGAQRYVGNPVFPLPSHDFAMIATYTNIISSPSPAPLPPSRITNLSVQAPPAASTAGSSGHTTLGSTAEPATGWVTLTFEGSPAADYTLVWSPALVGSECVWQPVPASYRDVLGETADGKRIFRISAEFATGTPAGFFRVEAK